MIVSQWLRIASLGTESVLHSKIEKIVSRQLDSGRQHSYVFAAASDRYENFISKQMYLM